MSTDSSQDIPALTRNQALVFGALSQSREPLSAYAILDQLHDRGFRAPPQVYRALNKLVTLGLAHRVESLNAFVACRHPDAGQHPEAGRHPVLFAICEACHHVAEITDEGLADQLTAVAGAAGFAPRDAIVELRGHCKDCQP